MREPRAAIVGLGAVCPMGQGVPALWSALFEHPSLPSPDAFTGLPDDGRAWTHGHRITRPAARLGSGTVSHNKASRFELLAMDAIMEACTDAGVGSAAWQGVSMGLAIGTAAGDTEPSESGRLMGAPTSFEACNPYAVVDRLPALLGLSIDGPVFSVSNACAAALYAIAQSTELIAQGAVDAMLVVGTEVLSRVTQSGMHRMTALDPHSCRPFDASRHGTVLGEGAAALLLVSPELAQRLGRQPYCIATGFGASCDAHHPTAPHPEGRGIRAALQQALHSASRHASEIAIVVPHGTGTPQNDLIEGALLTEVFSQALGGMYLMPIKAHLGHCAGASGAFSALAAAKALSTGLVPPTLHLDEPDPAIALRFSREPGQLMAPAQKHAVVNAYGFGGNNLSLLLESAHHA